MIKKICILQIVIFFIASCASVKVIKITPQNPDEEGIRFYRSQPYLLVTKDIESKKDNSKKDNSNKLKASIIWLPKINEQYAIKAKPGMGSVQTTIKLSEGWNLVEFGQTSDSKTAEMITALTGTLTGASNIIKEGVAKAEEAKLDQGLYAIIFDETTGLVKDLQLIFNFREPDVGAKRESNVGAKLDELNELKNRGKINEDEYKKMRQAIIESAFKSIRPDTPPAKNKK